MDNNYFDRGMKFLRDWDAEYLTDTQPDVEGPEGDMPYSADIA
jgi:hypothetical protein